jgi:hypothetical protein
MLTPDDPMAVSWPMLFRALAGVESRANGGHGLLEIGHDRQGAIFVVGGKIAWVGMRGLSHRLRDLLCAELQCDAAELEAWLSRQRESGRTEPATLAEASAGRLAQVERALRQHSVESLIRLCSEESPITWRGWRPASGAVRCAFRGEELLREVATRLFPTSLAASHREIEALPIALTKVGSFLVHPAKTHAVPLACGPGFGGSVAEQSETAAWAAALTRARGEAGGSASFALARGKDGTPVCVWWRGALMFSAVCSDRLAMARLAARHLEAA